MEEHNNTSNTCQAVSINHDILIKMIAAQPDTLASTRYRALLSLGYDFLARRSELVAIRSNDLKFTPDGALKGMRLKPVEIQPVFSAINHG